MSAAAVLPMVWATAERACSPKRAMVKRPCRVAPAELAFYRKYTEGMLRRYMRLSMEAGRAPSLLGREMFRGRVTHYSVQGFDDVVIFVHDVEGCMKKLEEVQQHLIRRIGLQEYTQEETATMMGLPLRSVHRWYADALDALTAIFLERRLLEPFEAGSTSDAVL